MKAYKLILQLLKHPFAEIRLLGNYICTGVRYINYSKEFTLDSINDGSKKHLCDECRYDGGTKNIEPCQMCEDISQGVQGGGRSEISNS